MNVFKSIVIQTIYLMLVSNMSNAIQIVCEQSNAKIIETPEYIQTILNVNKILRNVSKKMSVRCHLSRWSAIHFYTKENLQSQTGVVGYDGNDPNWNHTDMRFILSIDNLYPGTFKYLGNWILEKNSNFAKDKHLVIDVNNKYSSNVVVGITTSSKIHKLDTTDNKPLINNKLIPIMGRGSIIKEEIHISISMLQMNNWLKANLKFFSYFSKFIIQS